jgi:hypothetical protein
MSANLIVGKDPSGNKTPVAVDANGAVVISGTVSSIGNVETILNNSLAVETVMAADVATIKAGNKTNDGNGNAITSSTVGAKRGLDVNIIAGGGGGGGGGGISAQYNAPLPTYNNGDPTTLQTDVNGRLITTGGLTDTQLRASAVPVSGPLTDTQLRATAVPVSGTVTANTGLSQPLTDTQLRASAVPVSAASLPLPSGAATSALQTDANTSLATIAAESVVIDNKLPALSGGRIPVEANNAGTQVYDWSVTGSVPANSTLFGPIDCSLFREFSIQTVALGTGANVFAQISNDGTIFVAAPVLRNDGTIANNGSIGQLNIFAVNVLGAKFLRIFTSTAQTAGTTKIVGYASQQATPKLYQAVSGVVTANTTQVPSATAGYATYHSLVSAATTNPTNVKNVGGSIGTLILTNNSATWAYFKLCNTATAPTPGTTTAVINIGVAPNTTQDCSTAFAGLRLATGISYYVSAGTSLTDNTALPAAGTFLVNMTFI